jgi:hypothetical protein
VSLSQEPAFSTLRDYFVCGIKDISHEQYAGVSRRHAVDGQAIRTSNGAGPHNLQLFFLAPDGTVLHCLPGFWHPQDLMHEMELAYKLNDVWKSQTLTRAQKDATFRQMQLAHIQEHPWPMVARSRMQSFDQKFEARRRLYTSDTIKDPEQIRVVMETYGQKAKLPEQAFKTADEIVHQRMAQRPFMNYSRFDVAKFSDYGRPLYDKNEDQRNEYGQQVGRPEKGNFIGNTDSQPGANRPRRGTAGYLMQRGVRTFMRSGVRSVLSSMQ